MLWKRHGSLITASWKSEWKRHPYTIANFFSGIIINLLKDGKWRQWHWKYCSEQAASFPPSTHFPSSKQTCSLSNLCVVNTLHSTHGFGCRSTCTIRPVIDDYRPFFHKSAGKCLWWAKSKSCCFGEHWPWWHGALRMQQKSDTASLRFCLQSGRRGRCSELLRLPFAMTESEKTLNVVSEEREEQSDTSQDTHDMCGHPAKPKSLKSVPQVSIKMKYEYQISPVIHTKLTSLRISTPALSNHRYLAATFSRRGSCHCFLGVWHGGLHSWPRLTRWFMTRYGWKTM